MVEADEEERERTSEERGREESEEEVNIIRETELFLEKHGVILQVAIASRETAYIVFRIACTYTVNRITILQFKYHLLLAMHTTDTNRIAPDESNNRTFFSPRISWK